MTDVYYRAVNFGDGKGVQRFYASTEKELAEKIEAAFRAAFPIKIETGYKLTLTERG